MSSENTSPFGLGFVAGLFAAIGLDPDTIFIKSIADAIDAISGNSLLASLLIILASVLSIIPILKWLVDGDIVSIISLIVGILSGWFFIVNTLLGIIIMAAFFAYSARHNLLYK